MSNDVKKWVSVVGVLLTAVLGGWFTTGGDLSKIVKPETKIELVDLGELDKLLQAVEEAGTKVEDCCDTVEEAQEVLKEAKDRKSKATQDAREVLEEMIENLEAKLASLSGVVEEEDRKPTQPDIDPTDTSLTGQVARWLKEMNASKSDARALGRAFNSVLLGMQTGILETPTAIRDAQRVAWSTTLRTNLAAWSDMKQKFRVTLNGLRDAGQLEDRDDHIKVWTEIVEGTRIYAGD